MDKIRAKNIYSILDDLGMFVKGKKVLVSWDIDSLDPSVVSATGTPVHNGLSIYEMEAILSFISKTDIRAMDVVEFNPELGNAQKTMQTVKNLLIHFVNQLEVNRKQNL